MQRRCLALSERSFELVAPGFQSGDLLAKGTPGRAVEDCLHQPVDIALEPGELLILAGALVERTLPQAVGLGGELLAQDREEGGVHETGGNPVGAVLQGFASPFS
jgi:hypothetical protein